MTAGVMAGSEPNQVGRNDVREGWRVCENAEALEESSGERLV